MFGRWLGSTSETASYCGSEHFLIEIIHDQTLMALMKLLIDTMQKRDQLVKPSLCNFRVILFFFVSGLLSFSVPGHRFVLIFLFFFNIVCKDSVQELHAIYVIQVFSVRLNIKDLYFLKTAVTLQ